ncbi:hypothetical protein AKJ45_00105 [candidate division MSBL1 archaeon SCGC-AAA261F19]|uniref:Radical SAM core domain-containing protein n=2 Tax=candidate division MSBL1 TaxID=215777 RepID=A0A133VBW7_9EURY|nr:hypothetical protein AKJ43_01990 [candidate division MSBL1 archaeon SCGC-AAA261D19]KXB03907.1 hypothetical protein AKJ45_00105 [candidate division MSBL1 archaeon SCGC-AAA261F19]
MDALGRYLKVMSDNLPAKFMICRRVPVKTELSSEEGELWQAHKDGLRSCRGLINKINNGKVELKKLKVPEVSLLDLKVELARRILKSCHFCERECGVDRTEGETGFCRVGAKPRVSSEFIHYGEEPELVPSFTIFFSGCTFKCQFCQNWDISQNPSDGTLVSSGALSSSISTKRRKGTRNINWVGGDPTPNLHVILEALNECKLNVPSVWNSNMYLSKDGMNLLFGTQDVYLTDMKYGNDECALKYSKAPNYWEVISRNHKLAFSDAELIIRHLVLPGHVECCTKPVLEWIANNLGPSVRINLMEQYRPAGRAHDYPELSRRPTSDEMNRAFQIAKETELKNLAK